DLIELIDTQLLVERLPQLIKQTKILSNLYDVVCTNPPYMGSRGMNNKLSKYLTEHYPNTKSDLSTVMMEKSLDLAKNTGLISMINIPVWMFLKSYEKLRKDIIDNYTFVNMLHLGRGVFGSDFGTTAFVISNNLISQYKDVYRKLFKKQESVDSLKQKEKWFFENFGYFNIDQNRFSGIPGSPIAYWISNSIISTFSDNENISSRFIPKFGMSVGEG